MGDWGPKGETKRGYVRLRGEAAGGIKEDNEIKTKGIQSMRREIMGEQDANEMSGSCLDTNATHNPLRLADKRRLLHYPFYCNKMSKASPKMKTV